MKRKRTLPSRPRRILRRLIAAALLACLLSVSHYALTPGMRLRDSEELALTGKTSIVARFPSYDLDKPTQLCTLLLSENENAVLLSDYRFQLFGGWESYDDRAVDCTGPAAPVYASYMFAVSTMHTAFFGRITDDRIARMEVVADFSKWDDAEFYAPSLRPEFPAHMVLAEGSGYDRTDGPEAFCLVVEDFIDCVYHPDERRTYKFVPRLDCYDADGTLVYSTLLNYGI